MRAFFYGVMLQCRLDLRSKNLFITCYIVPLFFFLLMGGIFTAVMPEMKETLIPSMIVMGVSMGSLVGLPPSLSEIFGSDIKKVYKANGVPLFLELVTLCLSAFIHLLIMSLIIMGLAPALFDGALPQKPGIFLTALALYIIVSIGVGSILGLTISNPARLTMVEQLIFLPSIMLSGIMFPAKLLPDALEFMGKMFPSFWGYELMAGSALPLAGLGYFAVVFAAALVVCKWRCK